MVRIESQNWGHMHYAVLHVALASICITLALEHVVGKYLLLYYNVVVLIPGSTLSLPHIFTSICQPQMGRKNS